MRRYILIAVIIYAIVAMVGCVNDNKESSEVVPLDKTTQQLTQTEAFEKDITEEIDDEVCETQQNTEESNVIVESTVPNESATDTEQETTNPMEDTAVEENIADEPGGSDFESGAISGSWS